LPVTALFWLGLAALFVVAATMRHLRDPSGYWFPIVAVRVGVTIRDFQPLRPERSRQ
jgi:hypothetical protein